MTRFYRLLLLALLALTPVSLVRASQQNPVTLDVHAGYDDRGQYHVGHWFPVQVVVANDGGDLSGTIEWRFAGESQPAFRSLIDLPRGARKQVLLPVISVNDDRTAVLQLVVNGQALAKSVVRLNPIASDTALVGVLSSDQTLLNSLSTTQLVSGFSTDLSRMVADLFPSDPMVLAGLDVIVVHDMDLASFSDAQRAALEAWVDQGGTLLVGGGPDAARTATALDSLLPVQLGSDLRTAVPVTSLERLAGRSGLSQLLQGITANEITLRQDARELDGQGLIVVHDLGGGQVIFAAFDLALLRAWPAEPDLWQSILAVRQRMLIGPSFRLQNENLVRDSLQLAALKLPSPGILLLLIAIYIVVIGPVNFLILRRMRRIDLAWITTPVLVAAFLLGAYGISFVLRGTRPVVSQLALVQASEGGTGGQATAFVNIYSPQRHSYNLAFAPDALVSPGTFKQYQFVTTPVELSDAAVRMSDLLIDVSSMGTALVEQRLASVPSVQSQLKTSAGQVRGSLTNTSDETLYNAMIVKGDSAQSLGNLDPGASTPINLIPNQQIFPPPFAPHSDDIFNQDQVLLTLFNYDRFSFGGPTYQGQQGLPDRDAVYLLAWRFVPTLDVVVDGDPHAQQGMTLYLIRLNTL